MADTDGTGPGGGDDLPPGLDDDDLGEPIGELRGYEEAPAAGFFGRVIRMLQRRSLTSQLVTLSWSAMGQVVLEFLKVIHSMVSGRTGPGEER